MKTNRRQLFAAFAAVPFTVAYQRAQEREKAELVRVIHAHISDALQDFIGKGNTRITRNEMVEVVSVAMKPIEYITIDCEIL